MKIKIHITVESDKGQPEVVQEVAHLDRFILQPETLGLTLAEARSILAGIEQRVVEQQAAEFMAQQRICSHCGHERSCKGRHHIVFRTPFGKLRLESPRLYHCQCESDDRPSFSPLAELSQERTSPELIYLETKFAALVSYGLTVELLKEVLLISQELSTTAIRQRVHQTAQRLEDEWEYKLALWRREEAQAEQDQSAAKARLSNSGEEVALREPTIAQRKRLWRCKRCSRARFAVHLH